MAKRVARRTRAESVESGRVHSLFFDTPRLVAAEERDQSYVRKVRPRSDNQRLLMEAIDAQPLTLALGPAGTGKTYLAISAAVEALESRRIARILLSRPAVEAGENLGYLPGDLRDKLDPYLRPLYDALNDRLGAKRLRTYLDDGTIEIAPVAFMRGRTLNNCFVLIDEAQNCTYGQLKMLLTRLGWHSTMVLTGDPDQTDLLPELSGLIQIAAKLEAVDEVAVVRLTQDDVVRHPLVGRMLGVL
ncbi:MAG: PhoH family protein [Rhodospirillales bacterium]|nr:PhoH family protein [Rhodospirillales bacterium]QQS11213.1 MAG: PhoH family protein [Rhodospirillales bacterium]